MGVCSRVWVHTSESMIQSPLGILSILFYLSWPYFLEKASLSVPGNKLAAINSHISSWLSFLHARITDLCDHTQLFPWVLGSEASSLQPVSQQALLTT